MKKLSSKTWSLLLFIDILVCAICLGVVLLWEPIKVDKEYSTINANNDKRYELDVTFAVYTSDAAKVELECQVRMYDLINVKDPDLYINVMDMMCNLVNVKARTAAMELPISYFQNEENRNNFEKNIIYEAMREILGQSNDESTSKTMHDLIISIQSVEVNIINYLKIDN